MNNALTAVIVCFGMASAPMVSVGFRQENVDWGHVVFLSIVGIILLGVGLGG